MQSKILLTTALAAVIAAGCASQQTAETASTPAPAPAPAPEAKPAKAEPAKPKLQMGASDTMLAHTCAGCHGTNGVSYGPAAPTIAGLEADYLLETLQAYKSGDRHGTIMGRIALGYTDDELEQIADYFSKQEYVGWTQAAVGPKAKMGAVLHDKYCEKCHEDEGTSVEDVPQAGQWMPYIEWTLLDYLNGKNAMEKDMKKALDKMVAKYPDLSKATLAHNLSHFYGSRAPAGYKRVPGRLK